MAIMDPDPYVLDQEATPKAAFMALIVMAAAIRGDENRVLEILRDVHRDGYEAGSADMRAEMKPAAYGTTEHEATQPCKGCTHAMPCHTWCAWKADERRNNFMTQKGAS